MVYVEYALVEINVRYYVAMSLNPQNLSLDQIHSSPDLIRNLDTVVISDLAKSISANGLLQPILVRPVNGSYEIVFGNHRVEACRRLRWKTIPAVVRQMAPDEAFLVKLVENLQRNNGVDIIAEARGYISLIEHGWTINSIAQRIGKSDSYVSDRIGLIRRLHPSILHKVYEKGNDYLKPSHCELIARIKSKSHQIALSEMVQRKRLSVRTLELLISSRQPQTDTVRSDSESLYVRIPQSLALLMGIEKGAAVSIQMQSRKRIAIDIVKQESPNRKENRKAVAEPSLQLA